MDQHRNPSIWTGDENWKWRLSVDILSDLQKQYQTDFSKVSFQKCTDFQITSVGVSSDIPSEYILIGKGAM